MSNNTVAAPVYFYIVAVARDPQGNRLALSSNNGGVNGAITVQILNYADASQLWMKQPASNFNGGFGLINKQTNLCIGRTNTNQGSQLHLFTLDRIQLDSKAVWRDELTWGGINSMADWEQKINIPGNGPYRAGAQMVTWGYGGGAQNESWFQVPEQAQVDLVSINFNVTLANILSNEAPIMAGCQTQNNSSDSVQPCSLSYDQKQKDSVSFKDGSGLSIKTSVTVGAKIPDIAEVSSTFSVANDVEYDNENSQSVEKELAANFTFNVPPRSKVQATSTLLGGNLTVPYTAVFNRTYPNGSTAQQVVNGTFTRVSSYSVMTQLTQLPLDKQ